MTLLHSPAATGRRRRPRPFAALLRWLVAADARHRELGALRQLDDHLLRDVGIDRADLAREVKRRSYSAAS